MMHTGCYFRRKCNQYFSFVFFQAYENEVSSVRKAAVFCMVALHVALGEEALAPYLSTLNGPKLKLLDLYIKRAQKGSAGSSLPTSPKNVPML